MSDCKDLDIGGYIESWIDGKQYYPDRLSLIRDPDKDARKQITFLNNELKADYHSRYGFTKVNHEVDKENSTLIVRADLSIFAPDEQKMVEVLENMWSKHGLKIKILTQYDSRFDYIRFVHSANEQRAYYNYEHNTVVFSNYMGIRTIVHEFGHALGLNDAYYTIWTESACSYHEEFNNGNIMSINTGAVLPSHIEQLKKNYFE